MKMLTLAPGAIPPFGRKARLVTTIFFTLFCFSCFDEDPVSTAGQDQDSTWTYIVYDAADGNIATIYDNYLIDLPTRSSEYMNLIGLHDSEHHFPMIWRIDETNQVEVLSELGTINTGDEEVLYDLLTFAKTNYPADRYVLAMYGHGAAYYGCCYDEDERDQLRPHEMSSAITRAGGVDMILFTAPCIMGNLEVAYELRNCTDVVVGSEELSCFLYWQNPLPDVFLALEEDPSMSIYDFAELVVARMPEYMSLYEQYDSHESLTMAAVRTDRIENLVQSLDELALLYLADIEGFEALIDACYPWTTTFGAMYKQYHFLADIANLADRLLEREQDPEIRIQLEKVLRNLDTAVFAQCNSPNYKGLGGLSIFLPQSDFEWLHNYVGDGGFPLQFSEDTSWDELVAHLIEWSPLRRSDQCEDHLPLISRPAH